MSRKGQRSRQRGRRALDYRAMMSLHGDVLLVTPYLTPATAAAGARATAEEGAQGMVGVYDVCCVAKLPISASTTAAGITTRFDISGDQYPVADPVVGVVGPAIPFSTHVSRPSGVVCIGQLWKELRGKESIAELALRVHRAYNFQDPPTEELGFQPDAYQFFHKVLKGRPFNPHLIFPEVPAEVFQIPATTTERPQLVVLSGRVNSASVAPMSNGRPSRLVVIPMRES